MKRLMLFGSLVLFCFSLALAAVYEPDVPPEAENSKCLVCLLDDGDYYWVLRTNFYQGTFRGICYTPDCGEADVRGTYRRQGQLIFFEGLVHQDPSPGCTEYWSIEGRFSKLWGEGGYHWEDLEGGDPGGNRRIWEVPCQ